MDRIGDDSFFAIEAKVFESVFLIEFLENHNGSLTFDQDDIISAVEKALCQFSSEPELFEVICMQLIGKWEVALDLESFMKIDLNALTQLVLDVQKEARFIMKPDEK